MRVNRLSPARHGIRTATAAAVTASMVAGLFLMSSSGAQAASKTLVIDSLDRSVASGLGTATTGGLWSSYGEPVLSVSGDAARITGLRPGRSVGSSLAPVAGDTDVQSTLRLPSIGTGSASIFYAVEARKQADGSEYRGKVRVSDAGELSLSFSRTNGSTELALGTLALPTVATKNQTLRLEMQVTGTAPVQLKSRVWQDGATAPDWQYQVADANAAKIVATGSVGFWAYAGSSGNPVDFAIPGFQASKIDTNVVPPPGSVKPSDANTGVPTGTTLTDYTGPLTITTDGTVIDSKAVYGDLIIAAKNVVIKNSYLHCGSAIPAGNSGCVNANSNNNFNLTVSNNTIRPDHPSYYRDGIVGHEYTAIANNISHSNDGMGAFSRPGSTAPANVTMIGNYVHELTHWNNDPAHADGSHNDAVQLQGGANIHLKGNNLVGSVVAGDGLGAKGSHAGSAIIVNRSTAPFSNVVIEANWLDDGQNSVCINNGTDPNIELTLQNNFFGRNQFDFGNHSTYQIRIYSKSKSIVHGLYTNRWEDTNALLTDGRDTGIRYNGA